MSAIRYRGKHLGADVCVHLDDDTPISEQPVAVTLVGDGGKDCGVMLTTGEARAVAAALIASADEADAAYAAEPPARRTKPEKVAARAAAKADSAMHDADDDRSCGSPYCDDKDCTR